MANGGRGTGRKRRGGLRGLDRAAFRHSRKKLKWKIYEDDKTKKPHDSRSNTVGDFDDALVKDSTVYARSRNDWAEGRHPMAASASAILSNYDNLKAEPSSARHSRRRVQPLKQLCVRALLPFVNSLTSEHFDCASWESAWKFVWRHVVETGDDSFVLFCKFAAAFGTDKSFTAHHTQLYQGEAEGVNLEEKYLGTFSDDRSLFLYKHLVEGKKKHRIETHFHDGPIELFVEDLNGILRSHRFNHLVLLDLSRFAGPLNREQLLSLLKLENLVFLNVSRARSGLGINSAVGFPSSSAVDDHVLSAWSSAVRHGGKWPNLEMLSLSGCSQVGASGLLSLMRIKTLLYIEAEPDLSVVDPRKKSLLRRKFPFVQEWRQLFQTDPLFDQLTRRNPLLARKYYQVRNHLKQNCPALTLRKLPKGIMLDFRVFTENLSAKGADGNGDSREKLNDDVLWASSYMNSGLGVTSRLYIRTRNAGTFESAEGGESGT